ncbi:MAG: DHH family phosphoesterase [Thermoplasmata archaeon]|nr:DHH family phosphoesterase [Thermoplasmata archaeon]
MGIEKKAKELALYLKRQKNAVIIAHGDADGVAGAVIAADAMAENDMEYDIRFVNYLNEEIIDEYRGNFVFFIDVGNGNVADIEKKMGEYIIADHHFTDRRNPYSLNPFEYGLDGEVEISASGLSHMIARNMGGGNPSTAIIGAIGDLQDIKYGRLVGMNRNMLDGVAIKRDFRVYGRNMPIYKMLSFSNILPPFFRRVGYTISFLRKNGFNENTAWNEMSFNEKKRLFSLIVKTMLMKGYTYEDIHRLYGEIYEINGIDAREIAATVNSVAKYGDYRAAMRICRHKKIDDIKEAISRHRKNIREGLKFARKRMIDYGSLSYFHGERIIKDTILGTITGMLSNEIRRLTIGFAENEEGIKVSARLPYAYSSNINLSITMRKIATAIGGYGGGHRAAAGAIIPPGNEDIFLRMFNGELSNQSTL